MIVKGEAAVLERCLDCVKTLVDETIIVDTGPPDGTKEIIKSYAGRLYEYDWQDDFSAARNYSFSLASSDYCLWLDADDVLPASTVETLEKLKENWDPATDVVMLPYQTAFDESGRPVFSFWRERILRKGPEAVWKGRVHEAIEPFGHIVYTDAPIRHDKIKAGDPDRNLRIYRKMLEKGEPMDARHLYYYGRELFYHQCYQEGEKVFERFLGDENGWIENRLDASRQLAYCRYGLGKDQEALNALMYGLTLGAPRAENCCDIGRHFFDRQDYAGAAFWYEAALRCPKPDLSGGFGTEDCYGFLPCIQLCLCYDRMGDPQKACLYNEKAGKYKPEAACYIYNQKYFAEKGIAFSEKTEWPGGGKGCCRYADQTI